jgi:hypothetical protein
MTITPAALSALVSGDIQNFLAASSPGGIEAQEAAGQRELTSNFNRLPLNMREREREIAEKLGFVFGEPIDEVFVSVTPPDGWTLRPTEHSYHSDIIDTQGNVRGGMFYKAAFYDRRATVSWNRRYLLNDRYGDDNLVFALRDMQTGQDITTLIELGKCDYNGSRESIDAHHAAEEKVRDDLKALLDERYPDNLNPLAYWNE